MYRGVVIEITDKLSEHSAVLLARWIGGFNVVRNQKIRDNTAAYKEWKEAGGVGKPPAADQATSYIHKQEGMEFLKELPSQIRRNAGNCWYRDLSKALKGLANAPRVKGKSKKRSCYVTKELFTVDRLDDGSCVVRLRSRGYQGKKTRVADYFLHIRMPFPAEDAADALYVSRQGNRFWLSMAYEDHNEPVDEKTLRETLNALPAEDLEEHVAGYDIGVVRQVTGSDGSVYHMADEAQRKLEELEKRRKRYQRRYARMSRANDRQQGNKKRKRTNGELKLSQKLAGIEEKRANIRKNASHHISKEIAETAPVVAAFEDINLSKLTHRPKAKQCPETGRWLRNMAKAKAGLNKAILNLNLGQIRTFTEYKLIERDKLMIKVRAAYSSQECSECGHTDKANRPTQELFSCTSCGHTENADDNASKVLKKRGIEYVLSPAFTKVKTRKRVTARTRSQAREMASLGTGGLCKPDVLSAQPGDGLNGQVRPGSRSRRSRSLTFNHRVNLR